MVIESFRENCLDQIYTGLQQQGRMLPDGLHYVDNWRSEKRTRCFQLMETEDVQLLSQWAQ